MFEFLRTIRSKSKKTKTIFSLTVALVLTSVFAVPQFYYTYFYTPPAIEVVDGTEATTREGNPLLSAVASPFIYVYESVKYTVLYVFAGDSTNQYTKDK